jgi:hypothetical protein
MKFVSVANLFLAAATLCAACQQAQSDPQTNLGETGNTLVEKRFLDYVSSRENGMPGCHPAGSGKRILLTGFGPFQETAKNISGSVASALGDTTFWPQISTLDSISTPPPPIPTNIGKVPSGGIQATQRELLYNGVLITLCSLVLSVEWDLSAAAIIYESQQFKPDTVLMMGRGAHSFAVSLEAAAVNEASALPGYSNTGVSLKAQNTPIAQYVLPPSSGAPSEIRLSWNTQNVAQKTTTALKQLNSVLGHVDESAFQVIPQTSPSPNNTYICNNVSFAVQSAFSMFPVALAGEKITLLLPEDLRKTALGFFHFPTSANVESSHVWAWSHLILATALEMTP